MDYLPFFCYFFNVDVMDVVPPAQWFASETNQWTIHEFSLIISYLITIIITIYWLTIWFDFISFHSVKLNIFSGYHFDTFQDHLPVDVEWLFIVVSDNVVLYQSTAEWIVLKTFEKNLQTKEIEKKKWISGSKLKWQLFWDWKMKNRMFFSFLVQMISNILGYRVLKSVRAR